MPFINCLGRDNVRRIYEYSLDHDENARSWTFRVVPVNEPYTDFFEFTVTEVSPQTIKITSIENRRLPMYTARGIPEALIAEAYYILHHSVISSSNIAAAKSFANEFRTPPATKIWERLVQQGHAHYVRNTDTYWFIR